MVADLHLVETLKAATGVEGLEEKVRDLETRLRSLEAAASSRTPADVRPLTASGAARRMGIAYSTFRRLCEEDETFPRPFTVSEGPRGKRWTTAQIDEWQTKTSSGG